MGISREQALECLKSDDLIGMGMEADQVRRRVHPEGVATYALGFLLDGWALLAAQSDAEERLAHAMEQVAAAVSEGATGLRLLPARNGAGCGIDGLCRFEEMLRRTRRRFPSLWIEGFASAEIAAMATSSGLSGADGIARLRDAGLDAIAGDGPLLTDARAIAEWIEIHRAAHQAGVRTAAGMLFGVGTGETAEQRIDFLDAVRALQQETGGFAALVPVAAPAANGRQLDAVTAVERLKMLAVARMFLDDIDNVQADGVANGIDGLKVLQTALRFGANDLGTIDMGKPSLGHGRSEEDVRRIIRDAGLRPAERDAAWRAMMLG